MAIYELLTSYTPIYSRNIACTDVSPLSRICVTATYITKYTVAIERPLEYGISFFYVDI